MKGDALNNYGASLPSASHFKTCLAQSPGSATIKFKVKAD